MLIESYRCKSSFMLTKLTNAKESDIREFLLQYHHFTKYKTFYYAAQHFLHALISISPLRRADGKISGGQEVQDVLCAKEYLWTPKYKMNCFMVVRQKKAKESNSTKQKRYKIKALRLFSACRKRRARAYAHAL